MGYKTSEFKVKTSTAVAGVRGSDFIINATATRTEVTALGQTELEVVSVAAPGVNPTLVVDFERTVIEAGARPSEVEKVAPEEIEQIKREVRIAPAKMESEEKIKNDAGPTEASAPAESTDQNEPEKADAGEGVGAEPEGQQDESANAAAGTAVSETGASEANVVEQAVSGQGTGDGSVSPENFGDEAVLEASAVEESLVTEEIGEAILQGDIIIDNVVEAPLVLVSDTELIMPEELTDIQELEAQIPPELTEVGIIPTQELAVLDQQEAIMEQVQEEIVELHRSLPDFPGMPQ